MKKTILTLALTVSALMLFAGKIEDRYVTQQLSDGMLFFIKPYELPSMQKLPAAQLDVTYGVQFDTLTLNMSVYYPEILAIDSIHFVSRQTLPIRNIETFFIDKSKKNYIHRYSIHFPYSELEKMYRADTPFKMILFTDKGQLAYGYSLSGWLKEADWMRQIMFLIRHNRKEQ